METSTYPVTITEELFRKLDDSPERLLVFRDLFPDGKMPLTEESLLEGWDAGLRIIEMAQKLLSQEDLTAFEKVHLEANEKFGDATDQAITKNRPEFGGDKNELRKALLDAAIGSALRAHRKTIAEAIVRLAKQASTENST